MPHDSSSRRRAGWSASLVFVDVLLLVMVIGAAAQIQTVATLQSAGPIARDTRAFWEARLAELCASDQPGPALPPLGANPSARLRALAALVPTAHEIWRLHLACAEPRTIVVSEDLLHFRVDRYDAFEADPAPAFAKIRAYVDQYVAQRNQIYVFGHTDDTYTQEYNELLSYRRALQIAAVVRQHLADRPLGAATGYAVYPVGMGKSQLLPRLPGEDALAWRTRCRRIEISFRSSRPGSDNGSSR